MPDVVRRIAPVEVRQDAFCTDTLSPAPTEPSVIAWDHMYCVCQRNPFAKERWSDICSA